MFHLNISKIFVLFYLYFKCCLCENEPTFVQDGDTVTFNFSWIPQDRFLVIAPNTTVILQVAGIPSNVHFAIFQIHTQLHTLTMSNDNELKLGNHVSGSSIGLTAMMNALSVQARKYIMNQNEFNVTLLAFIMYYDFSAPVPGACNLEFEVEIAPWLRVAYSKHIINVDHEPALRPYKRRARPPSCETEDLHYELFHTYFPEHDYSESTFFDTIRRVRTLEGARENARETRMFGLAPSTRSTFSRYPAIGRVFVVAVTYKGSSTLPAAVYVPAVTYACDLRTMDDCNALSTTYEKILCALSIFVGLFVAFLGHRYFQTEMFLMGFAAFALAAYVGLCNVPDVEETGLATGVTILGLLGGLFWWFLWWFWGIPALSVLLVVLMLGFVAASCVFYSPISFEFLTLDLNFWSAFGCCWLLIPVFLILFTRLGNIISCAVLGSYAVIVPIDHYIGTSLKYIVYNTIRRATVKGFGRALLDPPYQDLDLIMTLTWLGLSLSATIFQYIRERKRPPFTPPPYEMWRRPMVSNDDNETEPLICPPESSANYQTI